MAVYVTQHMPIAVQDLALPVPPSLSCEIELSIFCTDRPVSSEGLIKAREDPLHSLLLIINRQQQHTHIMGFFNHESHQEVYGDQHEGKFSHELIGGAAAFEAMKAVSL